jgi:hypothetical protein
LTPFSRGQRNAGHDSASQSDNAADDDVDSFTGDAPAAIADRRSDAETGR